MQSSAETICSPKPSLQGSSQNCSALSLLRGFFLSLWCHCFCVVQYACTSCWLGDWHPLLCAQQPCSHVEPPTFFGDLRALISLHLVHATPGYEGTDSCQVTFPTSPSLCECVCVFVKFRLNEWHGRLAQRTSECQFHAKAPYHVNPLCQSICLMNLLTFHVELFIWLLLTLFFHVLKKQTVSR